MSMDDLLDMAMHGIYAGLACCKDPADQVVRILGNEGVDD